MLDEQPQHFTLLDVFWEVVYVGFVATGGFVGWKLGGHFIALFAGGLVGRILGVGFFLGVQSWVTGNREL
ncbi:MAG TPA: hypothetical protein VGE74_08305 [Gemmata sp.]